MNKYITINPTDTIGDSLSSVNINYLNLESDFLTVKLSSDKLWAPMLDYYLTFSPFLKSTTTIAQNNSGVLISAATTVERSSAAWIKPISIFYPSIFPTSVPINTVVNTVSSWVTTYFPSTDPVLLQPNYVENQVAIIYNHSWLYGTTINENQYIQDSTTCYTANKRACAYCVDYYYGGTWCGTNSWADCGGRSSSCQNCGDLNCYYNTPPYIRNYGNDKVVTGFISANIQMNFQDRNESDRINAMVFKIKNCSWQFDKFLTA